MRTTLSFLTALFVGLLFGSATGTGVAAADGCPSQQTVVEYSKGDPPYQCAQMAKSGKKSIAAWDTKSWSNETHIAYSGGTSCYYRSSSGVSEVRTFAMSGYVATFTNWEGGTRHFGTGVIWKTGPSNSGSWNTNNKCETSKGAIKNRILRITEKVGLDAAPPATVNPGTQVVITGYVSPSEAPGSVGLMLDGAQALYPDNSPVGGKIEKGKFKIVWAVPNSPGAHKIQVVYGGDTSKCGSAESSCGFSAGLGKKYDVTINGVLTTTGAAARAGTDPLLSSGGSIAGISAGTGGPGLKVKNASGKAGRGLSLGCPSGTFPISGELYGGDTGRSLAFRNGGIALRKDTVPAGRRVAIQLTCRERGAAAFNSKRASFGTSGADRLRTGVKGSQLLGGPGADRLSVDHKRSVAFGGVGADQIVVKAPDGIAAGGPGRDSIRSKASGRTLLIGGPGRDRIVAGGRALVNVRDGARDVVICNSSKVRVRADRKDRLVGPCRPV